LERVFHLLRDGLHRDARRSEAKIGMCHAIRFDGVQLLAFGEARADWVDWHWCRKPWRWRMAPPVGIGRYQGQQASHEPSDPRSMVDGFQILCSIVCKHGAVLRHDVATRSRGLALQGRAPDQV
jgi:hypothetical protein